MIQLEDEQEQEEDLETDTSPSESGPRQPITQETFLAFYVNLFASDQIPQERLEELTSVIDFLEQTGQRLSFYLDSNNHPGFTTTPKLSSGNPFRPPPAGGTDPALTAQFSVAKTTPTAYSPE